MTPSGPQELDWLAFRYIAGELADAETADFEQRLETDQSACEAVARAVQLTEAVLLAGPLPATVSATSATGDLRRAVADRSPASPRRNRSGSPVLAIASLCMLLLVTASVWMTVERGAQGNRLAGSRFGNADSLVAVWSAAGQNEPQDLDWSSEAADLDGPGTADGVDDGAEVDVPSWLLAAVAASISAPDLPQEN